MMRTTKRTRWAMWLAYLLLFALLVSPLVGVQAQRPQPAARRKAPPAAPTAGSEVDEPSKARIMASQTLEQAGPTIGAVRVFTPPPIAKYAKYEIAFDIATVATNPYFPYDPSPPAGVEPGSGISVDMFLLPPGESSWDNAIAAPCFYYQPVEELGSGSSVALLPVGDPEWRARFTPDRVGDWHYTLRAVDASGTSWSPVYTFAVVDSDNKGFIRISETDARFFEYSNGTPFVSPLVSTEQSSPFNRLADIRKNILKMAAGGIRFVRWFPNGEGANYFVAPFGDAIQINWVFGAGRTLCDDVDAQAGKRFSFRPYYYSSQWLPAVPGARYRLSFRAKVTGERVLRAELGNLARADVCSASSTFHESNGAGDRCDYRQDGWQDYVIEAANISSSISVAMRGLYVSSDAKSPYNQVQSGSIRIHSIKLQRDETGNGDWGPNLLARSDPDTYNYVDQRSAALLDEIFRLSEQYGVYHKLPMFHKNDYVLNRFQEDGSVSNDTGIYNSHFYSSPASVWYQRAYARYFLARWSYSTALHSLELGNENHLRSDSYKAGLDFAEYIHATSPRHVLVTNSFWGYWVGSFFNDPARGHLIDYSDKHWYSSQTQSNHEVISNTWDDSAEYVRECWLRFNEYREGSNYNKPIVRGEGGTAVSGTGPQHPDIALDPTGTYYHKKVWAHVGTLGYTCDGEWYPRLFVASNPGQFPNDDYDLGRIYAAYERFVQGEPLSNGRYQAIGTDLTGTEQVLLANVTGNLRAWGARDAEGGRAQLWIDNAENTWKKVVDQIALTPASADVIVQGLAPGSYTMEWWDTRAGAVARTENAVVGSDGRLTLRVDALTADVAVKLIKTTSPEPTVQVQAPLRRGWNLISLPVVPPSRAIPDLFASVTGAYDAVYLYDATAPENPWREYRPSISLSQGVQSSSPPEADETAGLWVHAVGDATLAVEGAPPQATEVPLRRGWNLVGYPSQTPRPVAEALASIAGRYETVYTLDAADTQDPWKAYHVDMPPQLNDLTTLTPGRGYWIKVTADCIWRIEP
mgnify:CR=1 FL=1